MTILPQTIIQVVASGGGMVIDLEKHLLLPDTMIEIAAAAGHSGALVTFRIGKTIMMPNTMIQVAAAGRGRVIFEID
jgi:hypothetical protein